MSEQKETREITLVNKYGLHVRPAGLFAKVASRYDADVEVEKDGNVVSGKSIMALMTLEAVHGTVLKVSASGPQAKEVLDELEALLLAELVGAVALLAVLAVDHRVGEAADVAGGLPDARVHDDRGVEADDVLAPLDGVVPPGVADVALELRAHGAVVPEAVEAAVDLGGGEDEARALAERGDRVEVLFHVRWCR